MGLIRFSNEYLVGHEQIDAEHQYLFECVNVFYDAWSERQDRKEISRLLTRLISYSEQHFRNEEAIMRDANYPGLAGHEVSHERLVESVFALAEKLENRAFNPSHDTLAFLRTWLTEHILHEDMQFKAFRAAQAD